jgi:hypothetical protein
MLHSLNAYERIFHAYVKAHGLELQSTNTPEWKALARQHRVKVPDFRFVSSRSLETLVDVKGSETGDNYVMRKDVDDLLLWKTDVRPSVYVVVFAFVQPHQSGSFELDGNRYRIRGMPVDVYQSIMKQRSAKWNTVCVAKSIFDARAADFEQFCDLGFTRGTSLSLASRC